MYIQTKKKKTEKDCYFPFFHNNFEAVSIPYLTFTLFYTKNELNYVSYTNLLNIILVIYKVWPTKIQEVYEI